MPDAEPHAPPPDKTEVTRGGAARAGLAWVVTLALLGFVWTANSGGLLSSNDGSHLALARALALRHATPIDDDRALTLEIDLAERAGHAYSDRPPGTGFVALPAVWIGDRLDPWAFDRAMAQVEAREPVDPLPAAMPYISTYAARLGEGSVGPNLADLIATSVAISIHAVVIGLLGMLAVDRLLRSLALDPSARLFAVAAVGLGTAWGPYSTTLFAHGPAALAVTGFLAGIVQLRAKPPTPGSTAAIVLAALTGAAGAWAVACDYLLVLAIVPATLATAPWRARTWAGLALGAAPVVLATLAYHHAAFGSPLAIGYDHHAHFEFTRTRAGTFSGDPLDGLWTLWGLGRGAGLLAQAPVSLAGLAIAASLVPAGVRRGGVDEAGAGEAAVVLGRALLAFLPWAVALAFHRTPWGGGTGDHRYLIPILPFAAVGLGLAWSRSGAGVRGGLLALTLGSTVLVWRHFLGWHEAEPFARMVQGAVVAALVLMVGLLTSRVRRS